LTTAEWEGDLMKEKLQQVREASQRGDLSAAILLANFGGWLTAGIPFIIHFGWTVRTLNGGADDAAVPRFSEMLGAEFMEWAEVAAALFVRPGTMVSVASFSALWILIWLGLSIHSALRDDEDVLGGVVIFLTHVIAAVIVLLVATPSVWILFAGWGPSASAFAPPLVLLFITVVLNRRAFDPLD